ncbi:hypothetical protein A6R68_07964, partial [Neotoma lepida]
DYNCRVEYTITFDRTVVSTTLLRTKPLPHRILCVIMKKHKNKQQKTKFEEKSEHLEHGSMIENSAECSSLLNSAETLTDSVTDVMKVSEATRKCC